MMCHILSSASHSVKYSITEAAIQSSTKLVAKYSYVWWCWNPYSFAWLSCIILLLWTVISWQLSSLTILSLMFVLVLTMIILEHDGDDNDGDDDDDDNWHYIWKEDTTES